MIYNKFMFSEKIARFISVLLGPHVWLPLLFILIIFKSGLTSTQAKVILPSILLLQVVLPLTYMIIAPRLGWVSKWDMELKEERKPFFLFLLVLTLVNLTIIYFFGNNFLFDLNIIFIVLLLVLFGITKYWKISLHLSLNTASLILINFLFSWQFPFLYLIIPIIFWARLKLKKHTVNQLSAGVIITAIVIIGGLKLFGYL